MATAFAKQRKLLKTGTAVAKATTEEIHFERDVVSVGFGILEGAPDFGGKCGSQNLIRVEEKDPVISERQRVHGPLALLGPAALVVKLDDLCAVGFGDTGGVVGTPGVDQIDFANIFEGGKTAREVVSLIARRDDDADGKHGRGAHGGCGFRFCFRLDQAGSSGIASVFILAWRRGYPVQIFTQSAVLVSLSELCRKCLQRMN